MAEGDAVRKKVRKWPDGNRRRVTNCYQKASAEYRDYLRGLHPKGTLEHSEARKVTRGLTVWGNRREEIQAWLGTFDSARTLLEEYPQMTPFVDGPFGVRSEARVAGGPPPEWMRVWLPQVSLYASEHMRRKSEYASFADALKTVYPRDMFAKMVNEESAFYRALKRP